jgi:hypothetical protein
MHAAIEPSAAHEPAAGVGAGTALRGIFASHHVLIPVGVAFAGLYGLVSEQDTHASIEPAFAQYPRGGSAEAGATKASVTATDKLARMILIGNLTFLRDGHLKKIRK